MDVINNVFVALSVIQTIRKREFEEISCESVSLLTTGSKGKNLKVARKCWSYPKSNSYFSDIWSTYDDVQFVRKYRISKITFNYLCEELKVSLCKNDTQLRKSITVQKRIAVALHFLKSNCDADTIGDLYGIGRSTAGKILLEFCDAVVKILMPQYVKFPEKEELDKIANAFENKWGFPGVIGSLDGSHIPILSPKDEPIDYYNYKKYHSINLMAVSDARYKFIMANVGQTGRNADSTVFSRTMLHQKLEQGQILQSHQDYHLISDAAFPLRPWLLKPFIDNCNTPAHQKYFNYRLSRARMTIENAFGRLKGRWRILLKRIDHNVENCVKIVNTCVVLHNLCESRSHEYLDEWEDEESMPNDHYPQPETSSYNSIHTYAEMKREMIAKNLKEL